MVRAYATFICWLLPNADEHVGPLEVSAAHGCAARAKAAAIGQHGFSLHRLESGHLDASNVRGLAPRGQVGRSNSFTAGNRRESKGIFQDRKALGRRVRPVRTRDVTREAA